MSRSLAALLLLVLLAGVPAGAQERPLVLLNATVHTADGPPLEGAAVLVEAGRIAAVGDVEIPANAERVDLAGRHLSPGYISTNSVLGLTEISAVDMTNDFAETGDLNPNVRAEIAVNPDSELIPVARVNGITSALVIPRGGDISGSSALIRLDGWTWEDLAFRAPAGLHVIWPRMTPREGGFRPVPIEEQEKQRDEALARIPEAFEAARAYWKARDAEAEADVPRHDRDVRWEAMGPALRGEVPVFVHASDENQIRAALEFLKDLKIPRAVLVGGFDAEAVAPELVARDIPVIVAATLRTPEREDEAYDRAYTLPARLKAAGVRFCIADDANAGNARNLPYEAAMAASFGLDPEEALRAITLYPAQILGVEADLGSIRPGRIADLVVTDGPPLEITSAVEQVYMAGRAIPMESRHTRLFEHWRARPRREAAGEQTSQ